MLSLRSIYIYSNIYSISIVKLEAIKNQLENKLNNNLRKKEERLRRELDDISVEDHSHHLETMSSDLLQMEARTDDNRRRVKGVYQSPYLVMFILCPAYIYRQVCAQLLLDAI